MFKKKNKNIYMLYVFCSDRLQCVPWLIHMRDMMHSKVPLTKEIRLKIIDPIISNSFPVRYYGISGTNLPDIP